MEELPKLINSRDESIITINNSSFSIGRSLSCDHIVESLGVSRFHCIIKKNDNKWILFDRSSNGTVVNSTLYKFNESVDLKDGDVIKLGPENSAFVFTCPKTNDIPESHATPPNNEIINEFQRELELTEEALIGELQQPFPVEEVKSEPGTTQQLPKTSKSEDMMDDELTCSICSELFIKAVTLNCSHTFCKYCIDTWKQTKSNCPICRKLITTVAPTLVVDNLIQKFVETQNDEVKQTRKTLIDQRNDMLANAASSSNVDASDGTVTGRVIEIFSEDEDYNSHDSDRWEEDGSWDGDTDGDYEDYDYYPDSTEGRYYGGYGRCYICNQPGHWANSCPYKRR